MSRFISRLGSKSFKLQSELRQPGSCASSAPESSVSSTLKRAWGSADSATPEACRAYSCNGFMHVDEADEIEGVGCRRQQYSRNIWKGTPGTHHIR